jgi:hypothetical protein
VFLDAVRTTLHRAINTQAGEGILPLRVSKDLARRLNVTLGTPLCGADELARRRAARARLDALRARKGTSPERTQPSRPAAPVMVYFEKGRNTRELGRVVEVLEAKSIAHTLLDVAGDEATMAFVTRAAGCKDDELPVVFVAGAPIGRLGALVEADVSGALAKAVYG